MGRLYDLIQILSSHSITVLATTVLDTTDSAIIRIIVDDPDQARELLTKEGFAFTESEMIAVELDSATNLNKLMAALLEAELNMNYMYSFIPQSNGKSMLALNMEDNDIGEKVLKNHQFHVLKQSDISR
ncbi:MAG: acetolactate synthase [Verrucomicrobiales bacterium]|nr:acetolactate synthase [Verrucomicrobiales bacterium]